jgi:polysaccharide pyruvyl transferase WcaK-like protein
MSRKKIGLLTPYTGDNLGDAAIQSAVIQNLQARLPDADFCMFTLNPAKTSALHQVPSFPITGVIVDFYSNPLSRQRNGDSPAHNTSGRRTGLVRKLRNDPALRALFQPTWCFAKRFVTSVFIPGTEVRHIIKMYGLLRGFDLLLVSGGGQVDDYWGGVMGQPYTLFKWGLLAKATKTEFIFLSVGVDKIDCKLSRAVIRGALKLARYRSYRDSGSKQLLADMKFTRADRVMPDLAFSYPVDLAEPVPDGPKATLRIGISPITYLRKGHWPRTNMAIFERYLETLEVFTVALLRKGHEVVLFATDGPDHGVIELLLARVRAAPDQSNGQVKLRTAPISCVRELFIQIPALDCVVASRLHGVILSHLCLKPVLAISYDRKVTRYMQDMEQTDYCLDIHDLEADSLLKTFESFCLSQDALRAILKRRTHAYRTELGLQYNDLVRRVNL